MSSGTDVTPRGGVVERWSKAQAELSGLARTLAADEAEKVVPACPLWTVHQLLAHQAGVAADVLAGRMDGAGSDEWTAAQVDERAGRPLNQLLDEWDADAATLVERLGPADGLEPRLLLDLWTHDQDVRSTVGRPGQRDGPAAEWVREWLTDFVQAKFTGAGLDPVTLDHGDGAPPAAGGVVHVSAFEFVRSVTGRRSLHQVRTWDWEVADPEAYVPLVPAFAPRTTDLLDPGGSA
jgi:uncharacterized protein (TIGR03083 family)